MTDPIVFNPHLDESLLWAGGSAKKLGLPADLLREVPRRLALLSGLVIASNLLTETVLWFVARGHFQAGMRYSATAALLAASTGVLVFSLRPTLSPLNYLKLALVFQVVWVASEAFATAEGTWGPGAETVVDSWSSSAMIVLIYPVIVPNSLGRTVAGSLSGLVLEPLVALFLVRLGFIPLPSASVWISRIVPLAIAGAAGILLSRLINRLGKQLDQVRAAGAYTLDERLGYGGMGEVWRASHRFLARQAAVKLIRSDRLQKDQGGDVSIAVQRFEREAQATAALRSLHTVQLYDFGVTSEGTFYYAMELLDGVDMSTLVMEDGPQPPERVAFLLRQACESLEEAHRRGLIHRDVKPANIFVCRYPFHLDFVKVLDFGMVKAQHLGGESADGLTRVGRVTGTPAFLPPEAVIDDYPKDGRADIYGLGCVAYWLLTGLPVFERESGMGMMVAHARETPKPVSEHGLDVPVGLDRIIMSCLEKHPDMRPSSAGKLGELLDELGIASGWTAERAAGWWRAREGRNDE